jgi:hypothetical protein
MPTMKNRKCKISTTVYGKTPQGQFLYDIAFANLTDKYLARKHGLPVAEIRKMRSLTEIRKLARQVRKDRSSPVAKPEKG